MGPRPNLTFGECGCYAFTSMLRVEERPVTHQPTSAKTVSSWSGKAREEAVQRMFTAIARWYDVNNTVLSFGLHHRWKRAAVAQIPMTEGGKALDIGSGTADLALLLAPRMGAGGMVAASDLNEAMLREGHKKIADRAPTQRVPCLLINAEAVSFPEATFDAVTAGFCIRNVGNRMRAFTEIHRVLKPGGRFVCLEFSRPVRSWLRSLYDWYSFSLLPTIGTVVARDKTGVYEYLPASIRTFPDQEGLKAQLLEAGFRTVTYQNLTGGIVAIHVAVK